MSAYVVVGFPVVHGSAEQTDELDIVPSVQPENLRRLGRALEELGAHEPALANRHGSTEPVAMRIYDLRIRANGENLAKARVRRTSIVDCVRMRLPPFVSLAGRTSASSDVPDRVVLESLGTPSSPAARVPRATTVPRVTFVARRRKTEPAEISDAFSH